MLKRIATLAVALVACLPDAAAPQSPPRWRDAPAFAHSYNLAGVRILVIAGEGFNDDETSGMANRWKSWGARVEFAGPARQVKGELESAPGAPPPTTAPTLEVEHLLTAVDPARYDLVYIAGGEGVGTLLDGNRAELARILDGVDRSRKVVAAICHGPLALSASGVVRGRRVTVQGTEGRQALQQAGAVIVDEIAVVDGPVVTGQWPHLETFAMTVAERLQYPKGDGPFRRWLNARPAVVQAIEDQRATHRFDGRPVPPDLLDEIVRHAMKAVVPPSTPGPQAVRLVVVREEAPKRAIAAQIFDRCKGAFAARGVPEPALRQQLTALVEQAPALVFLLVQRPAPATGDVSDTTTRANIAYAGGLGANLVLAVRSSGLGVSPLGLPLFLGAEPEIKQTLGAPDTSVLVNILGLGYPTVSGTPALSRPASDILSFERWDRGDGAPLR